MMRSRTNPRTSAWILVLLLGLGALGVMLPFTGPATAQDPPPAPVPEPSNVTTPHQDDVVQVGVFTDKQFAFLDEGEIMQVRLTYQDASIQPTAFTKPGITVWCRGQNVTAQGNWAFAPPPPVPLSRGQTAYADFSILSTRRPHPEVFTVQVTCTSAELPGRTIAEFNLTAKAKPYYYTAVEIAEFLQPLSPDQEFQVPIRIKNNGNQLAHYSGEILQPPVGWTFSKPPDVMIPAGEERIVNVSGIAPRDQLLYLFHSEGVRVNYFPTEDPGKGQVVFVPLTVDGVYVHPALIPLTLLALIILGTLIFMAVLAKRQIEEQILGKPVPPWRIPVERAYLEELEKTDPDEHYIVRHYLMEEEHASALLWYHHFKKATKKDRIAETKWYKTKKKQERKIAKLEKEHVKLSKKWERKIKFLEWRRRRKLKKVDRKLKALNKGLQAKLDKAHKKEVAKLKKRFKKDKKKLRKRQKKAEKKTLRKHDKAVRKEERKLYRENRKRAKRGDDLLPPPEIPEPEMPKLQVEEPQYPERPIAQEMLLSETKFQKKADRINTRFDKKRARKEAKRDRILARHRARVDGKTQRLLAKVPPEPTTHLYDHDEYVPEDEVIVEDDRSALARWLNIPTLEERELARRRMEVHQAQRIRLKEAGDEEGLKHLEAEWKEERKRIRTERKEHALAAHAAVKEEEAMARQRRKDARRRAKELTKEAKAESKEMRVDQKVKAKAERDDPTKVPVKTPASAAPSSGAEESRLKLRFGRRKAEKSEEGKAESPATAADKGQE
ncbi:MAG: hypothetical protein KY455_00135 [Euryarchaeota archaeon]|nr:hypothetical protein [Euryarchaeota archaeon]